MIFYFNCGKILANKLVQALYKYLVFGLMKGVNGFADN